MLTHPTNHALSSCSQTHTASLSLRSLSHTQHTAWLLPHTCTHHKTQLGTQHGTVRHSTMLNTKHTGQHKAHSTLTGVAAQHFHPHCTLTAVDDTCKKAQGQKHDDTTTTAVVRFITTLRTTVHLPIQSTESANTMHRICSRRQRQHSTNQHKSAKHNCPTCRQSDTPDTRTPLSMHSAPATTMYLQRNRTERLATAQHDAAEHEWHAQNTAKQNCSPKPPTPALHFRRTCHHNVPTAKPPATTDHCAA
jgi:hypothetical protein